MERVCPFCLVMRLWSRMFEGRERTGKLGALWILCRVFINGIDWGATL